MARRQNGDVPARSTAALLLVASALHCSLTTSLDDLTSGSAPDAGLDAASTGRDGSSAEGGPRPDADPGDGATADGPPLVRFCLPGTTTATFCDDFDDPGGAWSPAWSPIAGVGATLVLDHRISRSAPGSLATTTDGSSKLASLLDLPLTLPNSNDVRTVSVAYDLLVDTYGSYGEVGYIHFSSSAGRTHAHYLRLYPSSSKQDWVFTSEAYLVDGGVAAQDAPLGPPPAPGTWVHITVALDLVSGTVSASLDAARASLRLDPSLFGPGAASFDIGLGFVPPDKRAWSLHHDNVTVTWN